MNTPTSEKPMDILMVENDPMDAIMIRKQLGEKYKNFEIHTARDGMEALDYLRSAFNDPQMKPPDLIVMDVDIPKLNGYQVIDVLKFIPEFRSIPMVVVQKYSTPTGSHGKYNLIVNTPLRTTDKRKTLSPFLLVVNQYFKQKGLL